MVFGTSPKLDLQRNASSLNNSLEWHTATTKVRRLLADKNSKDRSQKETSLFGILSTYASIVPRLTCP